MCGIAGLLHFDSAPPSRHHILPMVEKIAHRGPDGEGVCCRGPVALGHRRLSIVDVEAGAQPMFNEDREIAVVFNGEIYNHLDLRSDLEARGHLFRTRCDTEVLLHAWEEWGRDSVEKLRGMFAFAIVDWKDGIVFLARDHFGIKPLYYTINQRRLAFASELQSLCQVTDFPADLHVQALDNYLSLGYIPAPLSVYRDVVKMPPATRLLVHFDGRVETPETYWRLEYRPQSGRTPQEWAEELEHVLRESVRAHLMADVSFGAFLSGGLDSTAVVSLMAQELGHPVKTFSIGFQEDRYNELPYAERVARSRETEHYTEIVKPDAAAILPRLVEHYGEPFGDSSAVPTYYLSRLARRHVPMVLSGDGGDEALGGYGKYVTWLRPTDPVPWRPLWKRLLRPFVSAVLPRRHPCDPVPRRPGPEDLYVVNQSMSTCWRRRLWRQEHRADLDFSYNPFLSPWQESAAKSLLSQAQYADYRHYLPDDILTKVDVASMAHGLEVRTPFVDLKVVELAAQIPPDLHVARNERGRWETKKVLKQVLTKYYDTAFIHRRKKGFAIPIAPWFEEGGSMRKELESRIAARSSRLFEYFKPDAVAAMLTEHGRSVDYSQGLWYLYFLDSWLSWQANGRS